MMSEGGLGIGIRKGRGFSVALNQAHGKGEQGSRIS